MLKLSSGITFFALSLSALSAAAAGGHAQLLAHGEDKTANISIEYDGDNARMQSADRPNAYVIARDGKAYSVMTEEGQTKVLDLAQVMSVVQSQSGGLMGRSMGGNFGAGAGRKIEFDVATLDSLKSTGKAETVAGIAGEIYQLAYTDKEGASKTAELVLSKDQRARDFSSAMQQLGKTMRPPRKDAEKPAGSEALWKQIKSDGLGLLRFGERMKLTQLDGDKPADKRFELPAAPTEITSLRDLMALRGLRNRP